MTENKVLEALNQFIAGVTDGEMLKSPDKEEFVHPIVVVGYLPPKNYLPEGYDVPCIVVGMEEGQDDGDEASIHIRITFAIYDPGENNSQGRLIPDMQGYIDLLHLMTKVRISLLASRVIGDTTIIDGPIKWKMYDEQPWPFFYGYMEFDARIAVQRMIEAKNILEGWDTDIDIPVEML